MSIYIAALSSPFVVPDQGDNRGGTEIPSKLVNDLNFVNMYARYVILTIVMHLGYIAVCTELIKT